MDVLLSEVQIQQRVRQLGRQIEADYQGKPLTEPLTILSDRRRPLPPFAKAFREMLAEHCRAVFPITRPKEGGDARPARRSVATKRAHVTAPELKRSRRSRRGA